MSQPDSTSPPPPTPATPPQLSDDQLKHALTAFKKRWKVTRLDDESKLGGGRPTTTGKASATVGIMPPNDFPRAVWAELARQGKMKDMGGGFYAMP